jgi:predicted small metal-binding protein
MVNGSLRVRCACGWEVVGSEDEVVAATQEHGRRMHNMAATREQVLAMAVGAAGTDATAGAGDTAGAGEPTTPRRPKPRSR